MFLKITASITLIVPLAKGIKKIWSNSATTIVNKIASTLTIIAPLVIGLHQTWKKK